MSAGVAVVLTVGGSGPALLATAACLSRGPETRPELVLVAAASGPLAPLVASVATRYSGQAIEASPRPGVALNAAVRATAGDLVACLPAGFLLAPAFLERCRELFARHPDTAVAAPDVCLVTRDGVGSAIWGPPALDAAGLLADPARTAPVFVFRRAVWQAAGGFDEQLEGLVEYEFCLRLALDGRSLQHLPGPMVTRELAPGSRTPGRSDDDHLRALRAVLTRHEGAIGAAMQDVLVAREIAFGRTRELHRSLLASRDADLAELDRLRAEAAHHRAYLAHHGKTAVEWGDLRRTDPVSRDWGYDRGGPIDRRYIETFLADHSSDVRGSVLEIQENDFTRACGGPRVSASHVLDIDASNPRATVIADLRHAPTLAADSFDCIILTQTLHVVDDMGTALAECYRVLRPGGVLLATFPAASRVCLEYGQDGDFWRLTPAGARHLIQTTFGRSQTTSDVFGNVLTNTAFLQGLGAGELTDAEYAQADPYFPALTGIRARKGGGPPRSTPRGVVLLYHRVDAAHDPQGLSISPEEFTRHLEVLHRTCTVVPLDEMLGTPPAQLPERAVALTFDDGYVDNLTAAAPLLERHGVPATFFLTTRWIDTPGEYWWDMLERILGTDADIPAVFGVRHGESSRALPTATPADRASTQRTLHDVLVHASLAERDDVVDALMAWSGQRQATSLVRRPMVADEIRELARLPGMTIGAHTVNHVSLPDQPAAVMLTEIEESRLTLRALTGHSVDALAFPYGALDRTSAAAVRHACAWGLTCESRPVADSFDAAATPRLEAGRLDASALAVALERLFTGEADAPRSASRLPAV